MLAEWPCSAAKVIVLEKDPRNMETHLKALHVGMEGGFIHGLQAAVAHSNQLLPAHLQHGYPR